MHCRWVSRLGLNSQMLQEVTELSPSQCKLIKTNHILQLLMFYIFTVLLISPHATYNRLSPAEVRVRSLPSVQPPADGTWWQALSRNPAYTKTCISRTRDWSWLSLVNENQEWPGTPCTNIIPQRATLTKRINLWMNSRESFAAEGPWLQYLYRKTSYAAMYLLHHESQNLP